MTTVKCVVDTCTHYLYGDRCGAENIDIMHEHETQMSQIAEQTMCKSFAYGRSLANYLGSADNMNWTGTAIGLVNPQYIVPVSITCTVSSCNYWGEGSICVAKGIEITGRDSNECQDTNCKTFEQREGA
jgi:hypothetical protein